MSSELVEWRPLFAHPRSIYIASISPERGMHTNRGVRQEAEEGLGEWPGLPPRLLSHTAHKSSSGGNPDYRRVRRTLGVAKEAYQG